MIEGLGFPQLHPVQSDFYRIFSKLITTFYVHSNLEQVRIYMYTAGLGDSHTSNDEENPKDL